MVGLKKTRLDIQDFSVTYLRDQKTSGHAKHLPHMATSYVLGKSFSTRSKSVNIENLGGRHISDKFV
jgi:hypothetical protein